MVARLGGRLFVVCLCLVVGVVSMVGVYCCFSCGWLCCFACYLVVIIVICLLLYGVLFMFAVSYCWLFWCGVVLFWFWVCVGCFVGGGLY